MSENSDTESAQLPDELPPVKPPSAGFILQLFVVPGLIVVAVIAVWLLFGKLAAGEQDWRGQLLELQHPNQHRRWRGALGLAQMLKADQDLGPASQHLSENVEIAKSLADLLSSELKRGKQLEDDLKYQAFLARTMGLFDLPDIVLIPLQEAIRPEHDREVRKNAIGAIAVIAGRQNENGQPLADKALIGALVQVSADEDPMVRQLSAFTLGLISAVNVRDRLEVMLGDADFDTRINAAVGLARQHDTRGVPVFKEVLQGASQPAKRGTSAEFEQFLALKNCLTAIEELAKELTPAQRGELTPLIEPIAAGSSEPKIRLLAGSVLRELKS